MKSYFLYLTNVKTMKAGEILCNLLWSTGGRMREETLDRESLSYSSKSPDTHKGAEEATSAYTEEPERQNQRGILLLADPPSRQVSRGFQTSDDLLLKWQAEMSAWHSVSSLAPQFTLESLVWCVTFWDFACAFPHMSYQAWPSPILFWSL